LDNTFDELMKLLSSLPTDRAMKELSMRRIGPAVTQIIETMAFYKGDMVRIMRHIYIRERCLMREFESQQMVNKTINEWIKMNPNYRIEAVPND